MRREKPLLSSR